MLLFLEDWRRFPTAILDTQTPNRSFVRIAALYKEMGVKNHGFPLTLVNPRLQGVNPYSEHLTLDQKLMIGHECKINPWYFFREILRAPATAGGQSVPFEANRGNMALYWSFFNHITIILIQIRQTGKSFSTDGLMTYLLNIRCTFTEINLLTKDDTLRAANIKRMKDIDSELPGYLRQRTKHDLNNTEELTVKSLTNRYRGHLPQKSPKMAYNVGRGLTSPIFHVDEGPFQPNIAISLPSALAAGTAARDRAALNGEPYGTIITTTAGKKDDRDGKYMYNYVSEAADWSERFFDTQNITELQKLVRRNSRTGKLRINATFNHRQLGKSDEWLKKAIEDSAAVGEDADRDFFNVWTSGTMSSPLAIQTLEKIRASQRNELYTSIAATGGYITKWFIPEDQIESIMKTDLMVMSLDTSDASGGDDISLFLSSVSNFETIAAGTYNETNLITFAEWLCEWLIKYENITMIIERKSSGVAILDYLLLMLPAKGIDPFKRLFNRIVNDYTEEPERYREICVPLGRRPNDIYVRYKKAFGFATSGSGLTSRTELYSTTLQNAAKKVGDRVRDLTTINQITGLVVNNGRVDHQTGEHDDMCFIGSTLIRTPTGNRAIKDLKIGDLVLTRKGYKPIIKLFCSKKEVITKFGITGTPNHPFITPMGEVEFKDLNLESVVYKWNEKLSIIEEKTIIDILKVIDPNTETTTTGTIKITNHLLHYIAKFMKMLKVKYHQNTLFITKTTIISTIILKIWNVLLKLNISRNILCPKMKEKDVVWQVKKKTIFLNGVDRIQKLLVSKPLQMVVNLKELITGGKIIQNLQKKSILKQQEKVQKQDKETSFVYNLMVADCHEYFVNDILVHNCIGWLLNFWILTQGKNLSFYGIDSKTILCDLNAAKVTTEKEYFDYLEQQSLRTEMEDIYNQLQKEDNEYIINNLEKKLKHLNQKLILEEGEKFSIDELINSLREEKRRARQSNQRVARPANSYYNDSVVHSIQYVDPRKFNI